MITDGVIPSLHIDYKGTRIKQYHKEGRALRTETTINNTRDFYIGKSLRNLPALRQIGFKANRRLLQVERISHDCSIGEDGFHAIQRPRMVNEQRASGLRFQDERVQTLLHALVLFRLLPNGFSNTHLRQRLEPLRGRHTTTGSVTYDIRRLRASRPHSKDSSHPPLRGDRTRSALRSLLHPDLRPPAPPRPRSRPPPPNPPRLDTEGFLPPARDRHDLLGRTGQTRVMKLDPSVTIRRIQGF